jgi:acetolactate synthase-1/2/3 large subunit
MRVSEYIASALAETGVRHVFMLTGGGAMFLNDALGHEPRITPIFMHHEQACAMAAEGYARLSGRVGVVNVTTGPGGLNALNGVFGAWTDSIPMLVVSGQVKRETCLFSHDVPGLRQLGDQEADIVSIARPIVKYAERVLRPEDIALHLEKALYLATHGRPGPCWLDIPIDVQAAEIDPGKLAHRDPREDALAWPAEEVEAHVRLILAKLAQARRPVVMAGGGVRIAGALLEFERVIRLLGVPVVTAWTHDSIASDDPLFCGRPGTIGTRAGNFAAQNADWLLVLGSRLNVRQTSYNFAAFAPKAYKMQVDIDAAELAKPTVRPDHAVHCDLKIFLAQLAGTIASSGHDPARYANWLAWCKERMERYPTVLPKHREWRGKINPYHFVEALFDALEEDDIVACGNAAACIVPFQAARLKKGQRLFSNSGSASMGYDLPAAIGAWFGAARARGRQRRAICLAGDGSLQLNVQELQTVAHHRLPIKLFVLNNQGYLSIKTSQDNFFGRRTGAGPESGVSFPDFVKLGEAYGIPSRRLDGPDFASGVQETLARDGPVLCEVMLDETQPFEPRMSSRRLEDGRIVTPPLEDMFPFLDRDELARNMLD